MMNKKEIGFSLIELLVTLIIVSLLMGVSIPFVHDFIMQQRTSSQINQLLLAIHYTRNEALLRGEVVTLCGSSNRGRCDGDWSAGYLVFSDPEMTADVNQPEQVLRYFESVNVEDTLDWRAFPTDAYLQMAPTGFTRGQNGTFYYCAIEERGSDARYARAVIVDQAGRARVSQDQDGDGVHENSAGEALVCG